MAKLTLLEKIRKVEKRAWTELNIRGRRFDSNIMNELRWKWEDMVVEYRKSTEPNYEQGGDAYMKDPHTGHCYHFGDVIA